MTDALVGELEGPVAFETGVPNLDVVTAGPRSSRAVEMLGSPRMAEVVRQLEDKYDLVVLDTPPVGIVSDATILSRMTDGVVYVVRAHQVSRQAARHALDSLHQVNARLFGAVVNAVDPKRGRTQYYYGYSYGYGYGYGSAYEEEPEAPAAPAK